MSDSDSDALLDPAILAAAAKRRKATPAPAAKDVLDLDKLLKANKKRQANMAKSDAAAADLRAREERLANEKAAQEAALTAPAAAASTSESEDGSPSADVDKDETAGLRATRLFTQAPRVPRVRALKLEEEGGGPLLRRLVGRTSAYPEVDALLHRGWVEATFASTSGGAGRPPAPPALLSWLLEVACFDPEPDTSASAARALGSLIRAIGTGGAADAGTPTGARALPTLGLLPPGVPPPDAFATALVLYGADAEALAGDASPRLLAAAADQIETAGQSDPPPTDLRRNLLNVLEILPACAAHWRETLGSEEVGRAVRWLWRMLIEPHAAPALLHLQDAIATLLTAPVHTSDAPPAEAPPAPTPSTQAAPTHGPRPALPTAAMLGSMGARLPHSSLLKLCQFLPPTPEGNALQADAACAAIGMLVGRRAAGAAPGQEVGEAGSRAVLREDGESRTRLLSRLVVCVCDGMRGWSVYTPAFHSVLLLLDAAVSCELPSGQQGEREDMRELRRLLGQVRMRAGAAGDGGGGWKERSRGDGHPSAPCWAWVAVRGSRGLSLGGSGIQPERVRPLAVGSAPCHLPLLAPRQASEPLASNPYSIPSSFP
jgi:hypothetical protein